MATPAEQIRELKDALAAAETRLAVTEDRVSTLQATVEKLLAKQEAAGERQARTEERMAASDKEAERWSGRVWQLVLAVWTTVMGLLGVIALAVIGFKK